MWYMLLAALRHVESSWTRDRTHVPCIGRRRILIRRTTREVSFCTVPMFPQEEKKTKKADLVTVCELIAEYYQRKEAEVPSYLVTSNTKAAKHPLTD